VLHLRAIVFHVGLYLFTLLLLSITPLLFLFPASWSHRYLSTWSKFALWWLKLTCNLTYQVKGTENIPPGPAVILSKHQSAFETIALQAIFPAQTWVLKRELIWIPFLGWGLALMQSIAIDRKAGKKALRQVIQQGADRLNKGLWVVVFPEGTRIAPGETGNYGIGGAMLAEKSGYPAVPVAHNAGEFWSRRSFTKRPGVVTFSIGEPIETEGKKATEINKLSKEWIENETRAISTLKSE
jgi:1-acyl-sn-glycerol-3-phosphate acyltransferase